MRTPLLSIAGVLALLPAIGLAQEPAHAHDAAEHDHAHMHDHQQMTPSGDAPIAITINPEVRVSVALVGAVPKPLPCGTAVELPITVLNQAYVTKRLEAELVGHPAPGVSLEFHPEPLRGLPQETRHLRITLTQPGLTDLTIAFRAHNEIPDLGGRDRIHFLMQCLPNGG